MQQYSNVHGDFVATANAGTKTITLSDFANNVISGDLGIKNFIRGEVYEIFANGAGYTKIALDKISFSGGVLTISSMTAPFKAGDTVAVYIEGRDKGFDEVADKYKIDGGGGGGVTSDTNMIEVGGEAFGLGQAVADDSLPIVLTEDQITTLTPPAAITNFALETGGALDEIANSSAAAAASLDILDAIVELGRAATNIIAGQVGVSAGAGAVAGNTPRTTLASDDPLVASTGAAADAAATSGSAGTIQAKLRLLTSLVNIISGQAGVDGGAGTISAKTIRTTMATDSALPTGTNKIGGVELRTSGGVTAAEIADSGSDAFSNSFNQVVVAGLGSFFNGTSWDRMRGTIANGLLVNISGTPQGSYRMSTALELSGVIKAAAGTLLACHGRLDAQANDGQYFLQFYDAAAVPADGAVTLLHCQTIEHLQNYSTEINFEYPRGKTAAAGISFALSTTEFTKTLAGETFLSLEAEYR